MSYIQSHQELAGHPKTKRAARALGVSIPTTLGHLHLLWYWALDYAPNGDLSEYEDWEIAEAAQWEGKPETFIGALQTVRFLDERFIHDWDDYAGRLIERRAENAERMRERRAAHVQDTTGAREQLEKSREEKSREEKKKGERARAKTPPPKIRESTEEGKALDILGAIPGYPLDTPKDLELLREPRDPRVNVAAEIRKWRDYHEPEWQAWRKKHPPNYRLSLRNWLENADRFCLEKHGPVPASHTPWKPPDAPEPEEPEVPMPVELKAVFTKVGFETAPAARVTA